MGISILNRKFVNNLIILLMVLVALFSMASCSTQFIDDLFLSPSETTAESTTVETILPTPTPEPTLTPTPTPTPAPEHIVVSFIGDCTLADALAWSGASGSFDAVVGDDYEYCFQNAVDFLSNDDMTLANFEGTYGDEQAPHQNKEFVFAADPASVAILQNASIECVNLSNNHSYDYWQEGLELTQQTLDDAGILWSNSSSTAIYEVRGIKIGMFGIDMIANGDTASTAYPLIDELREAGCQIIIASCHWGIERYYDPTPEQTTTAHDLIDHGVDIVVGHHPHRLEPIEIYNGKYIMYSLSNFCFGGNTGLSDPDTCIVRCEFVMDATNSYVEDYNLTVIPFSQTSFTANDYCPRLYEWGSDDYFRVMDRLNWNGEDE